jgi:general secretion pathway protein C
MGFQFGALKRPVAVPALRGFGKRTRLPLDLVEAVLIVALVWAAVSLFWTLVRPMGPVGRWQASGNGIVAADPLILTRFDPFFRLQEASAPSVTSLNLKLFGTRIDSAMGRGAAFVTTPDGIQNSYVVGDEIVPGVKLKAIASDNITIERGGATEQLYLDQSVAAAVVQPGTPPSPGVQPSSGAPAASTAPRQPLSPKALVDGINFLPRMDKGVVTGFQVAPKGSSDVFTASGLQQGDVVTQIDGTAIRSAEGAMAAINGLAPGARVSFTVDRGGKSVVVTPGAAR